MEGVMLAFSLGAEPPAIKKEGRPQMSASVSIPIAGFKDVYDVAGVEKALHELPASAKWKNAKPGKVFDTFVNGDYANPVIVVDEIDKASADGQYDPLGALYELLETQTATRFVDEFVELPIDASGAVWLATANDAGRIPEPLLNRLTVYEIEPPDDAGSLRIARTIYGEVRGAHEWGKPFPQSPSDAALEKLAGLPPREMRRAIQSAFGNAKLAGHSEVGAD